MLIISTTPILRFQRVQRLSANLKTKRDVFHSVPKDVDSTDTLVFQDNVTNTVNIGILVLIIPKNLDYLPVMNLEQPSTLCTTWYNLIHSMVML
jgi:hypothetical protein